MRWKQLATATALTGALLFPAMPVAAIETGLTQTGKSADFATAETDIPRIVSRIVNVILTLLGILLMMLFFYGGFEWMTAGGDPTKVKSAKSRIQNATIGLLIILASYTLSSYVLSSLITATTSS